MAGAALVNWIEAEEARVEVEADGQVLRIPECWGALSEREREDLRSYCLSVETVAAYLAEHFYTPVIDLDVGKRAVLAKVTADSPEAQRALLDTLERLYEESEDGLEWDIYTIFSDLYQDGQVDYDILIDWYKKEGGGEEIRGLISPLLIALAEDDGPYLDQNGLWLDDYRYGPIQMI